MKRVKILLIILLLSFIITTGTASSFHFNKSNFLIPLQDYSNKINDLRQNSKDTPFNDFIFEPIDIQLEDDAFHGPKGLYSYEWWYFDATLDNGYSVQISIRSLNVVNRVFFTTSLNVYKDGYTVSNSQNIYYKEEVSVSMIEPLVILDEKEIMKGYIDNDTGDWIYLLNLKMDDMSVNFTFVGETKGWKGRTPGVGWWGVILPRATVTGTLNLNGIEMDVSGIGYHDHNWHVTATAGVNYGWYWGKIYSSTYTITWADVKLTRFSEKPFVIFNKKDGGYINIPPDSIKFTTAGVQFNNGKFIPTSFRLIINYENIRFGIDMDVLGTHHFRRFGFINYWRYHLHCYGHGYDTTIGQGQTEIIDEYNIAELLRFR
jgi:predicted secreted hydrolase